MEMSINHSLFTLSLTPLAKRKSRIVKQKTDLLIKLTSDNDSVFFLLIFSYNIICKKRPFEKPAKGEEP